MEIDASNQAVGGAAEARVATAKPSKLLDKMQPRTTTQLVTSGGDKTGRLSWRWFQLGVEEAVRRCGCPTSSCALRSGSEVEDGL